MQRWGDPFLGLSFGRIGFVLGVGVRVAEEGVDVCEREVGGGQAELFEMLGQREEVPDVLAFELGAVEV